MKSNKVKRQSWFRRHWVFSTLLLLLIFSSLFDTIEEIEAPKPSFEVNLDENSSLDVLLLPNDVIDTKYLVDTTEIKNDDSILLVEGKQKLIGSADGASKVTLRILKFKNEAAAFGFYKTEIGGVIEKRGYQELFIEEDVFDCFLYEKDLLMGITKEAWCVEDTIVVKVRQVGLFASLPSLEEVLIAQLDYIKKS